MKKHMHCYYTSVFCCWLGDNNGIWPIKNVPLIPKRALPKQVVQENQEATSNTGLPGKSQFKCRRRRNYYKHLIYKSESVHPQLSNKLMSGISNRQQLSEMLTRSSLSYRRAGGRAEGRHACSISMTRDIASCKFLFVCLSIPWITYLCQQSWQRDWILRMTSVQALCRCCYRNPLHVYWSPLQTACESRRGSRLCGRFASSCSE